MQVKTKDQKHGTQLFFYLKDMKKSVIIIN